MTRLSKLIDKTASELNFDRTEVLECMESFEIDLNNLDRANKIIFDQKNVTEISIAMSLARFKDGRSFSGGIKWILKYMLGFEISWLLQ